MEITDLEFEDLRFFFLELLNREDNIKYGDALNLFHEIAHLWLEPDLRPAFELTTLLNFERISKLLCSKTGAKDHHVFNDASPEDIHFLNTNECRAVALERAFFQRIGFGCILDDGNTFVSVYDVQFDGVKKKIPALGRNFYTVNQIENYIWTGQVDVSSELEEIIQWLNQRLKSSQFLSSKQKMKD